MSNHVIYLPGLAALASGPFPIEGEEAHHVIRVRRLETGDQVRVCDGRGLVVVAKIAGTDKVRGEWRLMLEPEQRREAVRPRPSLTVCASPPKGDRLSEMIDGLSQAGAAEWRPLMTGRTVVEPRSGKLDRLQRIAIESLKQCGREWLMTIGEPVTFEAALGLPEPIVADASGEQLSPGTIPATSTLLIGPEGGWTPQERSLAAERGVRTARLGPHVMRIETAAVVGAALIMSAAG